MSKQLALLTQFPAELLAKETPDVQQIMLATVETRINKIPSKDLSNQVVDLITKLYFDTGRKQDPDKDTRKKELAMLSASVISKIKIHHYMLTLSELGLAFEAAAEWIIKEKLPISPAILMIAVKNYKYGQDRMRAMQRIQQMKQEEIENQRAQIDDKTKAKIEMNGCLKVFAHFEKTGNIIDVNNATYNYLKKLSFVNLDEQTREQILKKAQDNCINRTKMQIAETQKSSQVKDLRSQIKLFADLKNDRVQKEAKKIALEMLFKDIIKRKKSMKEILTRKPL